jgi:MFS transporter, CP family, cyanate transporter
MHPQTDARRLGAGYGLLVVAAGLNLRHPITTFAAALGDITSHYGLNAFAVAVLSSLPVLMLAAGAPLAPLLERRLGPEWSIAALSVLLAVAVALRPFGAPALFAGTVVAGAAISGLSVLMPQLIRERLAARAGLWSGAFSTSFGVSAAVGAGITLPLVSVMSLPLALAVWALPIVLLTGIAVAMARRAPPRRSRTDAPDPRLRLERTPLLWQVTGFFGCQALVFFATTAWLPTIYADRGLSPDRAAGLLALASIAGLPAALGISLLASRLRRQHLLVAIISAGSAAGLAGVGWAPVALAPIFVAVLGFAQGSTFGLAIALVVLKADPARPMAPFSAFAQGVGYAIAAAGPLLLGLLRSYGEPWSMAIAILLAVVVAQAVSGWAAGRTVVTRAAESGTQPVTVGDR